MRRRAAPAQHHTALEDLRRVAVVVGFLGVLAATCAPLAGCATVETPAGSIGKVHAWWKTICAAGDGAFSLAETAVRGPVDAGQGDASPDGGDGDGGGDRE
jgi:hypothetical protein